MNLATRDEFIQFYEQHVSRVRGLLFRLAGEGPLSDLTQETFLKAWDARESFRGESDVGTWIYRIAYNCAMDFLRRSKPVGALKEVFLPEATTETIVDHNDLVEKAMAQLDLPHKSVVILFYFQDTDVRQISEILKIPEGTVKSRLSTARAQMLKYFEINGVRL